jgi:hypothetical protein
MPEWPLLPGDKVERKQLHDQFGGRQRVGLGHHAPAQTCCCSQIPLLASNTDTWMTGRRMDASTMTLHRALTANR